MTGAAYAQFAPPSGGCPQGMHIEGFSCVYDTMAPEPGAGPQWLDSWGAIADGNGVFGTAQSMQTKRKAEKAALRACKENGGDRYCKIAMVYRNQCVVYAMSEAYDVGIASSEAISQAESRALEICGKSSAECRVRYSACSLPVQVR
ncbi:MAG: DUF4189 domain-containing protein [Lysobacter sp.]|nr:DUF4189 domain-containing protein [Lysobacter sp.]